MAGFAALIGYPTTRRGGTPFAMISLAVGELVHAAAGVLPEWFGGEGGLTADRTAGPAFAAGLWPEWSLGSDLHVYYLTAVWTVAGALAIHALGRTPLLKLANAVRDNPQRVAFIGYDPHRVRYLMLTMAGFFAGVAGGLMALNLEIASADSLGALRSGAVLLAVVVGGSGLFLGPVAGAVVVTFFSVALSRHTGAWQLYLGLVFAAVVLVLPGGLAGGARDAARLVARRELAGWLRPRGWAAAGALGGCAGLSLAIELAYGRVHGAGGPAAVSWFGLTLDPSAALPWAAAGALLAPAAVILFRGRGRAAASPGECDA
ncbi:branched-chain amino acid ABC transporter permease [Alcaligenaceae bacterium SAGV5]|nr:branched-chain amino acid ABC transporter permease [Alcaligenaceae bacterium SAGV5]